VARFEIQVVGDEVTERHLNDIADRAADPRPGLRRVADMFRDHERDVFATAGEGTWRPLQPETIRQKGSARPLVATGALMRSLTVRGGGNLQRVTRTQLRFGTKVWYAKFQKKHGRPPIMVGPAEDQRVADILVGWIARGAL
jgi:phage gpG-like protein